MSIHVALHHTTRYRYDRLVNLGPQVVRLRPAPHCRTPILAYSMTVEPAQHFINWQQDPFSNYLARLVFPERTEHFEITIDLVAEMSVYNPFDFFLEASAEQYPFSYDDALKTELAPYLACDPQTSAAPLFRAYLDGVDRTPAGTTNFLVALNQQLQRDIGYLVRMEPGVQTPAQTLELASGSCRDSAWLLVQLCRHLGIAARFVSGYLIQLTPDVKSLDGPSGTSVDFTDLHAWCEVYLPGAGWIGFDPTSGLLAGEGHIPLACTPQPTSAAPVEGLIDECEVSFEHEMSVTRVYESPRVTKPYTESQWDAVLALGTQVDGALAAGDVRLTQGGEPTFVSIDDRDGAEWNTDALGPTKRGYATELVQRLRAEYGEGGFLHFGQGKWYPGEQLPRWALSIFWRADGQPVWRDPSLFADEREPSAYTTGDAKRFIDALAARLNLTGEFIQPGYEDVWYYLWRERRLPVNVDPFDARLDDELERARLRKVFEQQLDSVVGYVLPVKRTDDTPGLDGPRWQTGPWFFRDERMYLVPGDSPMGYRLPLDSLPWAARADHPYLVERDPFAPRDALPDAAAMRARYAGPADAPRYLAGVHREASAQTVMQWRDDGTATRGRPDFVDPHRRPERFESAAWITRTALCVEVRNGILYLFMPPLAALEDYLELLGAIELTAQALGVKLVLEGYPPPRDARLKLLQVTPDPGVIEVNIHPAASFDELVDHTEFLYDAAWQSRLCSEKFMVDGRHVGTGGGNHFVLGGATPADSPFLRRPDLLASLIAYWHNHPSLSYLFSGLFIGPTSQAPRVDEARNDQLYELDIAFAEIQRNKLLFGQDMPPWLVDRVLRNLLIDVTGNTHRSEFCIDKLYSPDSSTGRLGLLELRAFEMPPHARMSIVQQLLLRALVARFWAAPYTTPLTRWGTALHDRFMLPEFLQMDFDDVLAELRDAGFAFDPAWFAPHFEFRFPLFGQIAVNGMELSLRGALEPWHVMGEEGAAGGTVRYVDSSVERLEVRVTGLNDNRHVVTVNGRALPLQPTGTVGEYVAGVRYKAWSPPSALHPTIGVHAPLTFDIVDTWLQRSLGGCRYHVAHPGGRNYATFPVNAYEAESRRLARFVEIGHTPGRMDVAAASPSREFPFTLDLRRP
ncbi:transglutaminase family protein [Burkholderia cenocepacia]|uniref:transglutaminase family protein n=1 Tax=Burkholderia TaxID=32008 RepID=UPI000CFF0DCA|nr:MULTISPECIES: transglutaminase family protein [Burkholderia]ELK7720237.1 transglutaminase family protein [Burkholderia cenocepacia]MBL3962821.1 transglutaminase family protein [Burkholderia sp. KCJ3K979]MBR8306032.1 transglutaminase family protein [Burkholderia cenocepacia]MCF1369026.1 transglutaminase family protein [Burkholderia cenocepacia]MCF1386943.1 transglutaminase family protein [Burkholderia cenocepacia]